MSGEVRLKKLRWLCRRGMKELDVLLESFLVQNRDKLIGGAYSHLESLLGQEDDQLWAWFQKTSVPEQAEFIELVDEIRRGT